jgi:hypothetical protein
MVTSYTFLGVVRMEDQRKDKDCLKIKVRVSNTILGKNIQLNEITSMQNETLVGCFVSKHLFVNTL